MRGRVTDAPVEDGREDEALVAAIAAGDDLALKALYERHAPWIAVRLRRTLPASAVEDVLQETFLATWRGAGRYAPEGPVAAWLWGIARRQAANWARTHQRPDLALDLLGERPGSEADPADQVIRRQEIQGALATAGPSGSANRQIARKALVEDRPLAEIAADLDMPVGTVKSRLHRIRAAMRAFRDEEANR
jgi:RNA polymerase sigma-70 factor (ECF subfamily)